ncbi:uncharacterized protein LOC110982365 [Acanthaster planci]|uniref:Uncharacterized protein LOC110982365 n=1 Tax=Acanthaster planci TaxID=133434 RepID=A0A8B7YYV3_ACAPL|nr:uncharacterized protein LOC110982365 [Acanthaster planci]
MQGKLFLRRGSGNNQRVLHVSDSDYVGALHQNGMLVKYSRGDSEGATRRRRGVYDEARNLHRAFFHNATADFPNLDISQWDSVAFELDSFYTEDKESKDDVLNNIETMLESYLTIRPEEFDTGARDSILRKIGEVLMDLSPDTAEARALIHRCRRMIRTVMSHVGQGLAEGDRITTRTGRSSVHIRRLTLRADQLIEAGRTKLKFPESLEQIGRSMTLNVEEYDDAEDLNSENGKKQPLSGPIRAISLMDADGNPYSISGLTDPIEITFSAVDGKHVCLYYDEMDKAWSRKGLTTRQERPGAEIVCQTLHLTDFATAVDVNKGPEVPVGGLTVAAVVGIIVGVLALLVIVLLIVFLVVKVNKNKKVNPKD